jgi:hypothetical protein
MRVNRLLPAFFVGMVLALWLAVPAIANVSLYSYLDTGGEGSGIATLQKGYVDFYSPGSHGIHLEVRVDYAIFAPGTYSDAGLDFTPYSSYSSLSDTDYVYAYQLHNQPYSEDVWNGFYMPRFSESYNFGYSDPKLGPFTGDVNPYLFSGGTVIWFNFFSGGLLSNKSSYVFLIASPYYPDIFPVSVINHSLSDQQDMPVPGAPPVVPIPGAMALAAMGLGTIFFGRLRRRF